jgi:hypothetical protein
MKQDNVTVLGPEKRQGGGRFLKEMGYGNFSG